jgi:hypothetical protein
MTEPQPQKYRSREVIEAFKIDHGEDANRLSVAAASGWMMGHNFTEFRVVKALDDDYDGFGLRLENRTPGPVAGPGDYIIRRQQQFGSHWSVEYGREFTQAWEAQS